MLATSWHFLECYILNFNILCCKSDVMMDYLKALQSVFWENRSVNLIFYCFIICTLYFFADVLNWQKFAIVFWIWLVLFKLVVFLVCHQNFWLKTRILLVASRISILTMYYLTSTLQWLKRILNRAVLQRKTFVFHPPVNMEVRKLMLHFSDQC